MDRLRAQRRASLAFLFALSLTVAGCGSSSRAEIARSTSSTPPTASTTTASTTTTTTPAATPGPEGVPLEAGPGLAPASSTARGTAVDGIACAPVEQVAYHIHVHLQVYVNGSSLALPGGIGMVGAVAEQTAYGPFFGAQQCYYWLHTHSYDGVIHIESPTARIYTLGSFFDEWRQRLSGDAVAGYSGKVTAIVNGKPWHGSPRAIPLRPHSEIELAIGKPVPRFKPVSWTGTGL